jgi:hypothetical protein
VNVRGGAADRVSIEHVLEKEFVLDFDKWQDCMRGTATNSRRKVMQHLSSVATFALVLFPGLVALYGPVLEVYRRLVNQLRVLEEQEVKTQSQLIEEKSWLAFGVLIELAASRTSAFLRATRDQSDGCAQLAMESALLMLMSRYCWRSIELTSLEFVTEKELESLAKGAKMTKSAYLENCGRNFIIPPATDVDSWVVLTNTYKTIGKYHCLKDTLVSEVGAAMTVYYRDYWKILLGDRKHKFAFVGQTGRELTGADIADLFQRLTGVRLLCNVRRQITTSWALQFDASSESFARLMRHSQKQQKKSYDRRSNDVQTNSALESINGLAGSLKKKRSKSEPENSIEMGDVVSWGKNFGKVVEIAGVGGEKMLTVLTLLLVDSKLKPIFGDSTLLERNPVFHFIASAAVEVVDVDYDDTCDVYVIKQQRKKGK